MTESRIHPPSEFVPHSAHRAMTPDDKDVFYRCAEMYIHPRLYHSFVSAGGDASHMAHFSRTHCGGRPISPWADDNAPETVVALLRATGDGL